MTTLAAELSAVETELIVIQPQASALLDQL